MLESRYYDGTYLAENPDWDSADASWKASLVATILARHAISPSKVCEVGCGSGDVLVHLARAMPEARLTGYDISPQAAQFWGKRENHTEALEFRLGDFHAINQDSFDVLLMLDVFEHVRDPFSFLEKSREHATYFVFHIPLDLSASSVARGKPLTDVRNKVGHLHFYTKDLALATLSDTGYEIVDWRYTGAALHAPNRTLRTRLAALPRWIAYALNRDFAVRLMGGETLLVLAQSR